MSLIKELSRRNVFRVMLTYAVAAWLLVEGMDLLTDVFEAPTWVMKVFVGIVVLGFIPVAGFSWIYEITPEGIKKEAADSPAHSAAAAYKLNVAVVVMLAIAIGVFLFQSANKDEATAAPKVAERTGPPMLAVLPFVSASLTGDSKFFAVGVHDDLLTQLAQLNSIRVISRTSVLEYQDTVRNIREIGKALGADAILEGGVQSAGDRIRINAQLIDAKTDEHLWAETYDRELTTASIFDVQTDIARAITAALKATLTEQDEGRLTAIPTENMAAYRAFHRAMEVWDNRTKSTWMAETRELLEEAVALDPTFTRAWAELIGVLTFENFGFEKNPEATPRAEQGLEILRQLAPGSADHLVGQAYYTYYTLKDYDLAYQYVVEAQALLPSDLKIVQIKSWIQRRQGDFEGRTETLRLAKMLDPRDEGSALSLIRHLATMHRYDEAAQELDNTDFDSQWFLYLRNALSFRDHQDLDRWVAGLLNIAREFEGPQALYHEIDALIAGRDFESAASIIESDRMKVFDGGHPNNLNNTVASRLLIYWLQGDKESLGEALIEAREINERNKHPDGSLKNSGVLLDMALVAAAAGEREETERLIRRWHREAVADQAEIINGRQYACETLGMAAAAAAAVECIRDSLANPSNVFPFLEPRLPFYDPIREEPEFIELLAELGV
jgi:TolB-like protein